MADAISIHSLFAEADVCKEILVDIKDYISIHSLFAEADAMGVRV